MKNTTVGRLMVNKALPSELRSDDRVLNKKGLNDLLRTVAQEHPEKYREISHNLSRIGYQAAYTTGGNSFGLQHLLPARSFLASRKKLRKVIRAIMDDDNVTDDERDQLIIRAAGRVAKTQQQEIYDESLEDENPLAYQVMSGSRGNPMNLASLRGSDLLYTDHHDKILPIPVMRSYSEGLLPVEYWANAYGARKGVMDTKFATQDAGFLSKQLNQIVHRSMVTALDYDGDAPTLRGLPVDIDDDESEGALLAHPVAGYKRNTVLTPKVLQDIKRKGALRILVRSPIVGGTADGGVYARDAGYREFGRLSEIGENIGMTAAQALSEPLAQSQLSSKHAGGVAGASASQAVSGFDRINQLVQVPKTFKGGAAHSEIDGLVQRIEKAPAGGQYVWIENQRHYVGKDFDLRVKKGDHVEAGDVISEGLPNPSTIVKYKGVGEGRRYFVNSFREAFRDAGLKGHRRNIELLSRGLINHVRLTEEMGDYNPDDIVPYSSLEHSYRPRPGYAPLAPKAATGKYLERPYLHYSIGTKVRKSMLQNFDEFGIKEIDVHDDEPPFQPEMVRGMANLQHDPDWLTRMFGSGLKSGLTKGVHYGATSDATGTSFVPGLARGIDFGQIGKVRTPKTPKLPMVKAAERPPNPGAAARERSRIAAMTPFMKEREKLRRMGGGRVRAKYELRQRQLNPPLLWANGDGQVPTIPGEGVTDYNDSAKYFYRLRAAARGAQLRDEKVQEIAARKAKAWAKGKKRNPLTNPGTKMPDWTGYLPWVGAPKQIEEVFDLGNSLGDWAANKMGQPGWDNDPGPEISMPSPTKHYSLPVPPPFTPAQLKFYQKSFPNAVDPSVLIKGWNGFLRRGHRPSRAYVEKLMRAIQVSDQVTGNTTIGGRPGWGNDVLPEKDWERSRYSVPKQRTTPLTLTSKPNPAMVPKPRKLTTEELDFHRTAKPPSNAMQRSFRRMSRAAQPTTPAPAPTRMPITRKPATLPKVERQAPIKPPTPKFNLPELKPTSLPKMTTPFG